MKKISFSLFILLFSCSRDEVNNYILTDQDLINVFSDFHLIDAAAKQGVLSLYQEGLIQVILGNTTIEEIAKLSHFGSMS